MSITPTTSKHLPAMYPRLNSAVEVVMAYLLPNGFDTTDIPELCDTYDKLRAHYMSTGRIRVWTGASDRTIFGDPAVNHAFRAWHDLGHIMLQAPFTPEGEEEVCALQMRQLARIMHGGRSGDEIKFMCHMLSAEVNGQIAYEKLTGQFPEDQRAFMLQHLFRLVREYPYMQMFVDRLEV